MKQIYTDTFEFITTIEMEDGTQLTANHEIGIYTKPTIIHIVEAMQKLTKGYYLDDIRGFMTGCSIVTSNWLFLYVQRHTNGLQYDMREALIKLDVHHKATNRRARKLIVDSQIDPYKYSR